MELDELLDDPGMKRDARVDDRGSKFKPRPKNETSESLQSLASGSSKPLRKQKTSIKREIGVEYVNNVKPDFREEEKPDFKEEVKPDFKEVKLDFKEEVKPDLIEEEKPDYMDMEGEVENEVVREIDVYYVPSADPNTNLRVMQYPLRPMWRPYELDDNCKEVRLKPVSGEMEVDLAVDVNPKNYNRGTDDKLRMGKRILESVWQKHTPATFYCVGILNRNKFYLHPVHATIQLRTSMQHLDKDSKRQSGTPNDVKVRVKSEVPHENPRSEQKSEQANDSEESWVPLKYHTSSSQAVKRCLHTMTSQEGAPVHFSMNSSDYLSSVCGTSTGSNYSKGPCIRWNLPLGERFKSWFLEGPPFHRFAALKHLAPDESEEKILQVLQEHGRLVQGLWVPKSSLLYGTNEGIEVLARDCCLLLFNKNVCISNSGMPKKPKFVEAMKKALSVLAVERPLFDDWKMKEIPDTSFAKRNPVVAKKHTDQWAKLEKRLPQDILSKWLHKTDAKIMKVRNPQ